VPIDAACPNCLAVNRLESAGGAWICKACGASFDLPLQLCGECGAATTAGSDVCASCGAPLRIFDQVMARHTNPKKPAFLSDVRSQAQDLKDAEGEASSKRMQGFVEIDRRREQRQAEETEKRRRADRQLLIVGLGLAALILLACIVLGVIFTS
jgi:hypothetical protein